MNKAELISHIADQAVVSRMQAETMVEAFTTIVTKTLQQGEEVVLAGFGAFSSKKRKGRMGVNPQKPSEPMEIPSVTVAKFKAGLALKKAMKERDRVPAATPAAAPAAPTPTSASTPTPVPTHQIV